MTHCPPRRILVAVDFGDASAAAVATAGRLAARFGSTLVAVHAESFEVPPYFTREQFARIEGELRAARGVAEASLRRFVGAHTGTPATLRVVDRPPVEAVLEAAADADLIVIGTHGRRGPKRWWLGSVAERVVREAPTPVLVVHAAADGTPPEPREVIMLAGTSSPELRAWAEAVASASGAAVREGPPVDRCEGAAMSAGTIVAVPLESATAGRNVHRSVAALARTCPVPVLFVPVARPVEATPA
jgi:nucleotide-binding universal stress UspA family protein